MRDNKKLIKKGHKMEYKFKTTFRSDFSIADKFGDEAVVDTYKRAFKEWKDNVVYITELSLVLSWKTWAWAEKDKRKARVYNDLWIKNHDWCLQNLKGSDLRYYLSVLD